MEEEWRNKADDWALVTGGSSGIGLAISERLASMGYHLLIVSIDPQLKEVERRLESDYNVQVRTLELNLARTESAGKLHDWCVALQIEPTILINNAGVFMYNDIVDTDPVRIETIINLHVLTTSQLSRLFTPDMVKKGRGRILNLSSYSAWMPLPGLALYSASKMFIRNFSLSLAAELHGTGVTTTVVLPAGVTSDLYGLSRSLQKRGEKLGILLTCERTAELALTAMFKGKKHSTPGALMRLMLPLMKIVPARLVRLARHKTMKFQK